MNAKQKLHQANLTRWAAIINDQMSSGLTIRQWCFEHNISFHAYNYWKRIFKEEYVDSVLPDIVPIGLGNSLQPTNAVLTNADSTSLCSNNSIDSRDLYDSHNSRTSNSTPVSIGDIRIDIGSS